MAAQRSRLERTRPSSPGADVAAERRFYRGVAGRATPAAGPAGALELRTRAVDSEVAGALGRGVEQVVVVRAGYDARSLRFARPPVRFFEVDRREVLADKRRRLAALGVATPGSVHVAVELLSGTDLGRELAAAGHDPARPTLFVCEELAVTHPLETTAQTLALLRARAAPESALVAGFEVAPDVAGVARSLRSVRRHVGGAGRDLYRPGDPEKLFVVTGWRVTTTHDAPPGRLDAGAHAHVVVGEPAGP